VATDPPNRAFKLCALRKEGMLDLLNSRKLNIMVKKSILRFVAIALQNYFVSVIFYRMWVLPIHFNFVMLLGW
jgi:hypothetical protein